MVLRGAPDSLPRSWGNLDGNGALSHPGDYVGGDKGDGNHCCYASGSYQVLRVSHLILITIQCVGVITFVLGQRGVLPFKKAGKEFSTELEITSISYPRYYNTSFFVLSWSI